jgi:hypothetical protein
MAFMKITNFLNFCFARAAKHQNTQGLYRRIIRALRALTG